MGEIEKKPVIDATMKGVAETPDVHAVGRPDVPADERPGRRFAEAVRAFGAQGGFERGAVPSGDAPIHRATGLDVKLPTAPAADRRAGKDAV